MPHSSNLFLPNFKMRHLVHKGLLISCVLFVTTNALERDHDDTTRKGTPSPTVETDKPSTCRFSFTVTDAQMANFCPSSISSAAVTELYNRLQTVTQDLKGIRAENTKIKYDNARLQREFAVMKAKYDRMITEVAHLDKMAKSWNEIVHWPALHDRFNPSNSSAIMSKKVYSDCFDVYKKGNRKKGIYHIKPKGSPAAFLAFCEDGWTIIQRRFDGSEDFYMTWDDYTAGFGKLSGEFWLGNEKIYLLTNQGRQKLKVEVLGWNDKMYQAVYGDFKLGDEDDKYRLYIDNATKINHKDALAPLNGVGFSTLDQDNDNWLAGNCAEYYHGGFWLDSCGSDVHRRWCKGTGCMSYGGRNAKKSVFKIRPAKH